MTVPRSDSQLERHEYTTLNLPGRRYHHGTMALETQSISHSRDRSGPSVDVWPEPSTNDEDPRCQPCLGKSKIDLPPGWSLPRSAGGNMQLARMPL